MLKTKAEKMLHRKYSKRGKDGLVQCSQCPLRVQSRYSEIACKATHSWNKQTGEWEPDDPRPRTR